MKITKRSFGFGIKLSHNYNVVDVSEGFEVEMTDADLEVMELKDLKQQVVNKVHKRCVEEVDKVKNRYGAK